MKENVKLETNAVPKSIYIRETSKFNTVRLISMVFVATYFLMPQYVGINLAGFDMTVNRIFLVILYLCILSDSERAKEFTNMIRYYKYLPPLLCFMFVLVYTGVLRADVNTLMNATIEFMFLFLLIYVIRYEIGIKIFLKITRGCSYILCILGIQEYVTGVNLFHKLQTLDANFSQYVRSGSLRIMGPCGHALAYGLLLILLFSLICVDLEKSEVNLLKHKVLFVLIAINVFLTGSRSSLAIFALAVVLIFLFSPMHTKKITILFMLIVVACVAAFVMVMPNNGMSRYIMLQITSIVDTVFGTNIAVSYGAETERLNNSSYYRQVLPKVFFVNYLNPILGRGVSRHSSFTIDGIFIISIDNFYVAQYIRYAYTGLIAYMWFVIASGIDMLKNWFSKKDGLYIVVLVGLLCYYINLWWMDSLQTLRYAYALFALIYVNMLEKGHYVPGKKSGEAKYESKYIRR